MPYAILGDFLVNAPLYQAVAFPTIKPREHQSGSHYVPLPEEIDRNCPACGPTRWKFSGGGYRQVYANSLTEVRYVCKNCEKQPFSAWIIWWTDGPMHV